LRRLSALSGAELKRQPDKKAKKKPTNEPSQVLPLLNGKDVEIIPPNKEAVLSPRQTSRWLPPRLEQGKTPASNYAAGKLQRQQRRNHEIF
jgi:hypothetical protein